MSGKDVTFGSGEYEGSYPNPRTWKRSPSLGSMPESKQFSPASGSPSVTKHVTDEIQNAINAFTDDLSGGKNTAGYPQSIYLPSLTSQQLGQYDSSEGLSSDLQGSASNFTQMYSSFLTSYQSVISTLQGNAAVYTSATDASTTTPTNTGGTSTAPKAV